MVAPSPVIASLNWMPSLTALVLRDSSRARRFLRSSRALRANVLPVHFHVQKTRSTPIVDSETAPVVLERRPRPMKPEASLQQESVRVSPVWLYALSLLNV